MKIVLFLLLESFMAECLTEVKREDLKKILDQKPSPNSSSQKYAAETRHQQEEQHRKKGRHHRQQQVPPQDDQYQQQLENQTVLMTKMAQQVQEMYNMLQAKRKEYANGPWKSPGFPFNPQSFQQNL